MNCMPEICRFDGIVIKMYFDDHSPPHFHVYYQDYEAVIRITDLGFEEGSLPRRQRALVLGWAFEHRDELVECWALARNGIFPNKIQPPED